MDVEIREHTPGQDHKPFMRAGHEVLGSDPAWVPPLDFEMEGRLNPKKNPFFKRGEATLFTAWRDGRVVGRCSASIDREYLRIWKNDTGFFGFLDTVDDRAITRALLTRAEAWLRERGMKRVMGNAGLYTNDEIGILVEGFEHPPVLSMGHSLAHQGRHVEACDYEKEKDLLCWKYDDSIEFNARTLRAWETIRSLPELRLRSMNRSRLHEELKILIDIYNDAWDGKWAFVPILPDEVEKMAEDMSLVLDTDVAFIAEIDGEPAGMCVMVPNLNEAIRDLHGKLFPFGWAKLLWRLKVRQLTSTRLILLGIRRDIRHNVHRYGGLSAAMYVEVAKRARAKGFRWSELSWTREDDAPINLGIKSMGAKVYKRYRVYSKSLA